MDVSYLHLLQIILLMLLLFGMYRITAPVWRRSFVPVLIVRMLAVHPVYGHFRCRITRRNLDAYDKYQIWRYIEKRKYLFEIESRMTDKRRISDEYFRRWFEMGD